MDPEDLYILSGDGELCGFRKADGTMATSEEHQTDAARYARNFAVGARMCHIFNHTHNRSHPMRTRRTPALVRDKGRAAVFVSGESLRSAANSSVG